MQHLETPATQTSPTLADLHQRITALEAQNSTLGVKVRRTRALLAVIIGVAGIGLLGAAGQKAKVAELQELRVVDHTGQVRASLTANPEGPGLAMYGADGSVKASLIVKGDTPALSLSGGGGATAVLSASAKGSSVILKDSEGDQAVLVAQPGTPAVGVSTADGTKTFRAP